MVSLAVSSEHGPFDNLVLNGFKPLSISGARQHFKSTINVLPRTCASTELMRLLLRFDRAVVALKYFFDSSLLCSNDWLRLCFSLFSRSLEHIGS